MTDQRFPKAARLLNGPEFDRVFAARASAANPWLVVHGAANQLNHARLGLAVSRRCGNAVARNRWKRLLREAFRQSQGQLPPLDFVCVPRQTAVPALPQLKTALTQLAAGIQSKLQRARQKTTKPGGNQEITS